jgi:transcriptional regulator with XRE-family HTH domain
MDPRHFLVGARRHAGLSQDDLAERAGTPRPTLSSYEHGHRSPTLLTAGRILGLPASNSPWRSVATFTERRAGRGRSVVMPSRLPRLDPAQALAEVQLPVQLPVHRGQPTPEITSASPTAAIGVV